MKKKILCIALAAALFISGATLATAAGVVRNITAQLRPDITITLDGAKQKLSADPVVYNGTTYLPLRAVSGLLGMKVDWNGSTKTVALGNGTAPAKQTVTLGNGSYTVGSDIAPGKYDVTAVSGSGNFMGEVASLGFMGLNEILAAPGDIVWGNDYTTYNNLVLASGDTFTIGSGMKLRFDPK